MDHNKDDYEHYIDKINNKFKDKERDIAVVLLYLLVLGYSKGDKLKRENWKKSYESITQEKTNKIKEKIAPIREELNDILRKFEEENEKLFID